MDLNFVKKLVLSADEWRDRPWELYVNGNKLLELHPDTNAPICNPKMRQLKIEEVSQLSKLTDKLIIYEVRIVKHDLLTSLIGKKNEYALSFNGGVNKLTFQVIEIKESIVQGLAWILLLAR